MKVFLSVSLLGLLLHCVSACFRSGNTNSNGNSLHWDQLSAHYAPPNQRSTDPYAFGSFPLTQDEALENGFLRTNPAWDKCESESGNFLGHRFMKPGDPAVILLFGKNGYIAGVQSSFPIEWIESKGNMKWFTNQMFVKDIVDGMPSYTLTAYFIDPKTICDKGRTQAEFDQSKIGTGLYLQNGTDPIKNSMPEYPRAQKDVKWPPGRCVPSMGFHFWYDPKVDMNCDDMWPVFTLYTKGELMGFGWAIQQLDVSSFQTGFEVIPGSLLNGSLVPMPQCLIDIYDKGQLMTALHIYLIKDPVKIECPDSK